MIEIAKDIYGGIINGEGDNYEDCFLELLMEEESVFNEDDAAKILRRLKITNSEEYKRWYDLNEIKCLYKNPAAYFSV